MDLDKDIMARVIAEMIVADIMATTPLPLRIVGEHPLRRAWHG